MYLNKYCVIKHTKLLLVLKLLFKYDIIYMLCLYIVAYIMSIYYIYIWMYYRYQIYIDIFFMMYYIWL